jgi:hypothetical protein
LNAGAPAKAIGAKALQLIMGEKTVSHSVLDAIREGMWDYEPPVLQPTDYASTRAMPGTNEKIDILAKRAELGLPLWHDHDRTDYDDEDLY